MPRHNKKGKGKKKTTGNDTITMNEKKKMFDKETQWEEKDSMGNSMKCSKGGHCLY